MRLPPAHTPARRRLAALAAAAGLALIAGIAVGASHGGDETPKAPRNTPERPRAAAVGVGTGEEGESQKREGAERDPDDARHDLDDPLDGTGDGPVVVLRG
jgi:hypothetical protein